MLQIEKNIPMPPNWQKHSTRKHDEIKETLYAMEVDDSVFFHDYQEAVRFRGRAHNYKNTLRDFDRNFAIRTVDGGWRVWRVS
jgi:hypothetical protein